MMSKIVEMNQKVMLVNGATYDKTHPIDRLTSNLYLCVTYVVVGSSCSIQYSFIYATQYIEKYLAQYPATELSLNVSGVYQLHG